MAKDAKDAPAGASGTMTNVSASAPIYRVVSGDVPYDPADNVTYVLVNSRDKRVVASFKLPGHAANIAKFRLMVAVPSASDTYEAGRLDEHGNFKPYNFIVSQSS